MWKKKRGIKFKPRFFSRTLSGHGCKVLDQGFFTLDHNVEKTRP